MRLYETIFVTFQILFRMCTTASQFCLRNFIIKRIIVYLSILYRVTDIHLTSPERVPCILTKLKMFIELLTSLNYKFWKFGQKAVKCRSPQFVKLVNIKYDRIVFDKTCVCYLEKFSFKINYKEYLLISNECARFNFSFILL